MTTVGKHTLDNRRANWRTDDRIKENRPGVPAEHMPTPIGYAHWRQPEQQVLKNDTVKDAARPAYSATFGSGQPARGISGMVRRRAYKIPDYRARRWMLLILADRVDTVESMIVDRIAKARALLKNRGAGTAAR